MTATCNFIDTCTSNYLTDHHNRPGEWLVGVPVNSETTGQDVLDTLLNEINYDAPDEAPDDLTLKAAARACFITGFLSEPFAPLAPAPDDDDGIGETLQAWFLFTWTAA